MLTVLVIDEDVATLALVRSALSAAGHHVETATSACAGLELLAWKRFDAVVLEVLLRDKEGVETIVEIRQRWLGCSIVAMSGGGSVVRASDALSLAMAVGASAALEKPFSAAELHCTLDSVLAGRAA